MRKNPLLMRTMLLLCLMIACRQRQDIQVDTAKDDESAPILSDLPVTDIPSDPNVATMPPMEKSEDATLENKPVTPPETPTVTKSEPQVVMQAPGVVPRIEALAFAHGTNLCLQLAPGGGTSLQTCSDQAKGQKFLFSRSLDGRVQLKDTSSQLCLAVGNIGFFTTLLQGEVCESKATQFFSIVDYGTSYSLKYDGNNSCMDAEDKGVTLGTRILLYSCSAALNQKIQIVKK